MMRPLCHLLPGVYGTWPEANAQIAGFSGNCHQKAKTAEEAAELMRKGGAVWDELEPASSDPRGSTPEPAGSTPRDSASQPAPPSSQQQSGSAPGSPKPDEVISLEALAERIVQRLQPLPDAIFYAVIKGRIPGEAS